jgi:short-subunit dehydrogenase
VAAVINVASVAGFASSAGLGVYSATKSFLISFGQALHDEARADGVVVSTLCPGLTRTAFQERAGMDDLRVPDVAWQDADEVARAGLAGAAQGRALVVPGVVNKGAVVGSRLVPMWAQRRVAGLVRARR